MLNICFWTASALEVLSLIFAMTKGNVLLLIICFNFSSREESEKYDTERISKDISNLFFICGLIIILGIILSLLVNTVLMKFSFILSLILIVFNISAVLKRKYKK